MGEMKKPEKGGTPKKITTEGKPGDTGPWGANPARNHRKGDLKRSANRQGKLTK